MLPFARILEYGNIAPVPHNDFKIISTNDALLLVTESGDLWVRGYNRYGKLGIGNNTTQYVLNWTKVRDDVRLACGSGYATVVLTKDNRILYCGDKWFETGGSGSSQIFNWTDVTYQFGVVDLSTVKYMKMTYYCVGLVTTGNQLFAKGYDNQLSFGGSANKATAVFIANNVQDLYTSLVSSIYVDTSGVLHRCGLSTNGSLGSSVSLTSYQTYSKSGMQITDIGMMTSSTGLLYTDSTAKTRYYVSGTNTNSQMGAASSTSYIEVTGSLDKFSSLWEGDGVLMSFAVGKNTNELYYCGTNTYNVSGDNIATVSTFTLSPMLFNEIEDVLAAQRITLVKDKDKWYYSGSANTIYGLPDVTVFTELSLPF